MQIMKLEKILNLCSLSVNLHMHLLLTPPTLGVLQPPGTGCSQLNVIIHGQLVQNPNRKHPT